MFDEVDSIGGTLKIEDFGEFDVQWQDETLIINDVSSEQLKLMVEFLRNGPKMMDVLAKFAARKRNASVTDPPQPVAPPPAPELDVKPPKVSPTVKVTGTKSGRLESSKPNLSNVPKSAPAPEPETSSPTPQIGLDPEVVQREYERQAAAKKKAEEEAAKAKAKAEAAAAKKKAAEEAKAAKAKAAAEKKAAKKTKAKPKPPPAPEGMGDMFAFMLPEGAQDVPEIPEEAKEQLDEKLRQVNAAAEALSEAEDAWQIPLVGDTYDFEGVNKSILKEASVVLHLASGTVVECDLEGNELSREEPEPPSGDGDADATLPQELATTPKMSKLVLHFTHRGMDKDAIVAALTELKQQGHPAVTNVDDIEDRVGMML